MVIIVAMGISITTVKSDTPLGRQPLTVPACISEMSDGLLGIVSKKSAPAF